MTALPGTVLADRYRIDELLSEGGMGAVYRGTDLRMSRPVAVKLVRAELGANAAIVERFRREAETAGSLAHPNIVQTTDHGVGSDGAPFIVMELLEGESLAAALRRDRRLPAWRVASIACQVLDALDAAHRAGIVHRDLKPMNVFLMRVGGGADVVKVLDFGIAKLMESEAWARLTATGQVLGSPAWMAPEQARGEAVDARADLYAVGLIAYRALAGELPWVASGLAENLLAAQTLPPRPLRSLVEGIDPALDASICRALEKHPRDRFPSAAEMRTALSAWASAPSVALVAPMPEPRAAPGPSAPVSPPLPKKPGMARSTRMWVIGFAAVWVLCFAALAVIGVVSFFFGADESVTRPAATAPAGSAPGTAPVPSTPAVSAPSRCDDTCHHANDGECDDGRPGSLTSLCDPGTDCTDCGAQSAGLATPALPPPK